MDNSSKNILICGLHEKWHAIIKSVFANYTFEVIKTSEEFEKFLEREEKPNFPIVIAGESSGVDPSEIAQALRMEYQDSKIFCVSDVREKFSRKLLIKNGFDDAFLMPNDQKVLVKNLTEIYKFQEAGGGKIFKPVRVVDIQPDEKMNFDVSIYLPSSNRHVRFAANGETLDTERVERLSKHRVKNMYIDSRDMNKFYTYTAEKLRALGKDNTAIGETEKEERLQLAMRELFVGIFESSDRESSLQEGREMMESSKKIVDSYILQGGDAKDWYKNVISVVGGERSLYSHASRVSTLAGLFSIALQKGNPEDLATAGMFHDLGLGEIPQELQDKEYDKMNPEEKQMYALHPSVSVKLLKMKKIVAPSIVYEAIEQHHETYNGMGFPKGIVPPKLKVESQILAMADRFDELTCPEQLEGKTALAPLDAIQEMVRSLHYDPILLGQLKTLFEGNQSQ